MSFGIHDFLAVANLHPGAANFAIKIDPKSQKEFIKPLSGHFPGSSIEISKAKKNEHEKLIDAFSLALEKHFGQDVADFAMHTTDMNKSFLDAHTMRNIIAIAEKTASKNELLRKDYITSDEFMLLTEYVTSSRAIDEDPLKTVFSHEYNVVVTSLKKYENDIATLSPEERCQRLEKLTKNVTSLLNKQESLLAENSNTNKLSPSDQEKLRLQQQLTKKLLDGVITEKL